MLTAAYLKLRENSSRQTIHRRIWRRCKTNRTYKIEQSGYELLIFASYNIFFGRVTEIVFRVGIEALETVSRCVSYRLLKINDL